MTARRYQRMRDTLRRRQPDLKVFLDSVHKTHNFSAILRTCDAVGVHEAHAVLDRDTFRANRAASAGTGQWVNVIRHQDCETGLRALQSQGVKLYAAHLSDRAIPFRQADYTVPCAVIMGAEKHGVSETAAELADEHVIIPMLGLGASLNVSVAAAVILYEAERQRENKDMYADPALPEEEVNRILFEWLHPKLAARCREAGQPYPPMDEDGAIQTGSWPG